MFPVWSRHTAMPWLLLLAVPVFSTDGSSASGPHPYDAAWDDVVEGVSLGVENATGVEMEQKRTPSKKGVRWDTHSRKWTASISFAGSQRYLGIFEKEVDQDYFESFHSTPLPTDHFDSVGRGWVKGVRFRGGDW